MPKTTTVTDKSEVNKVVNEVLSSIDKERERQIVSGRFGLKSGRKRTLEEIGQELGITRERVRQIEKQAVERLPELHHPDFSHIGELLNTNLEDLGRVAPVRLLAARLGLNDESGHAQVSFLAHLLPDFWVVPESDDLHHSVVLSKHHDKKHLHQLVDEMVETLKRADRPLTLEELQSQLSTKLDLHHLEGLARSSKLIARLENKWGHITNPLVNPKSIRDKIYVILQKHGKPLHFTAIAEAIKNSDFRRRAVTTQAIHNELIKDDRFVLVGRGIYALKEWGYSKGTVADVITTILKKDSPLHRDEIVQRVLKQRQVKSTTIILNLQGKKQFKRVAKATYALTG